MTLVALDVNATRVRVMQGVSREGRPLVLEGTATELPLAVSVEGRHPEPGKPGAALCRRSPHLACAGFLPFLGERREWSGARCKIDAARALTTILEVVAARAGKHNAAVIALPGYLVPDQRALVEKAAEQARLRLFGTVEAPLASALTAHAQQSWDGLALVLDIDDHALTWSAIQVQEGTARVLHGEPQTTLGMRAWKERLLGVAADACIRRSRRDPRDSPDAEQTLYDQLDGLLLSCLERRSGEITVQTANWSHAMILSAVELTAACRQLLDRTINAFHVCHEGAAQYGPLRTVVVSLAASRLPGLVPALENETHTFTPSLDSDAPGVDVEEQAPLSVRVMGPDAVAWSAHCLAAQFQRQSLPSGHLETAPLLEAQSPALGLARLQFRGREQQLRSASFLLGRDPRCDLVFETSEYPSISAQHCKIVFERQAFTLHDLSRHGTMINDRPVVAQRELHAGDWIRLGPGGPLLRFLGQTIDNRKLQPTA